MHRKEKSERLKSNVRYLIESRGETRLSLCNASGLTRTTIYNILEGRVVNVQQSTIRKISDFFGVSCTEIEIVDFEEKETLESSYSVFGNMNPAAVPIIMESAVVSSLDKKIGQLIVSHPLTYYFGAASNLIGVLLESDVGGSSEPGDLLIVRKGFWSGEGEGLVYDLMTKTVCVVRGENFDERMTGVVGEIVEERFNGD
ncbi:MULTISPECIES: helix-turn-helix transcriptional regulator [Pseudomonas]|uniref:helix-turn-helix domain-containing protein n=1 Tax=Pseudomonas TaxID=286 RepID=UPI0004877875|nr:MULTISPECIES: helix-turn-helix transcriptional regulator [Pseudomonas]PRA58609.1 XRE family transcriptional regulator [Pseudomonas sp. MYb115]QXN50707.1 helix-turn-helix domain-containing protein [Pseudomonas fluorescens]WSO25021.1 helix-turn-helix transcriptional regulator [Pseudomonas fluorescens]